MPPWKSSSPLGGSWESARDADKKLNLLLGESRSGFQLRNRCLGCSGRMKLVVHLLLEVFLHSQEDFSV